MIQLCIYLPVLFSQSIGVENLNTLGNPGWDLISDISTDNNGNYYITGSFYGQINVNGTLLISAGKRDIFVIKLDSLNAVVWAKRYGGEGDEHPHFISCNSNNLVYLSGSFSNKLNLATPLQAKGTTDAFFAQLNQEGIVQWSKALHSKSAVHRIILETDNQGNFYLAGNFKSNIQLNDTTEFIAQSEIDIFYAKFDLNGHLLLHKHIPGDGSENINALAIDTDNNIYIGGAYEKNMFFTPNYVNSYGESDLYLAKYDPLGNRLWYRIAGGAYNDRVKALSLDNKGNIYVACEFELSTKIGSPVYTATLGKDVLLIKSAVSNGAPSWIRQLGGNSRNTVSSIAYGNGKIYLSGNFRGEFQAGEEYKSEGIFEDAYIARYVENGELGWFQKAKSTKENNIWLEYQNKTNRVITAGYFSDDFSFASFQANTNNFSDVFFGSLIDCELLPKVDLGNDQSICSGTVLGTPKEYISYSWNTGSMAAIIYPDTSGTYAVLVEDAYGCFSEDNIEIIVKPSPEFELGSQITLPGDATLFLDPALPGGEYSYLWSTSSTQPTLSLPMNTLQASTLISLTVTDQNNSCEFTDDVLVINEDLQVPPTAVGINPPQKEFYPEQIKTTAKETKSPGNDENKIETSTNKSGIIQGYKIFPNPSQGKFYVLVPNPELLKQVDVFDIKGKHIKSMQNLKILPLEINLSAYPNGIYFLQLSEENFAVEYKLIKD